MKKTTEYVLNGWIKENKDKVVRRSMYITYGGQTITWETMLRYVKIEEVIKRTYYSVKEIVDMLNDCAGEDCYTCNWYYEIDEEGKIYSDDIIGFKIIGFK